jgi:glucose-6-phosphate isomerase
MLQLDYGNALDSAVGPAHGITRGDLARSEPLVQRLIGEIESERARGQHRYRDLPSDAEMLRTVNQAVKRRSAGMENLVVLGIGGSALGNIALQTALNGPYYNELPRAGSGKSSAGATRRAGARRNGPRLYVLDNVDPVQVGTLLDLLGPQLGKSLFNVISKSGETAETASQFLIVRDLIAERLGRKRLTRQIIVTTDAAQGTMREIVDAEGYESLPVPDGVGGRFSVLSAVGLFSAGMCGINLRRLLAGAREMSKRAASQQVRKNPAAMLALLLHHFYVGGKRLHVMMPYAAQLRDLADWYRQIWAESLGKRHDLAGRSVVVGPTPIMALGATDQHSQVQLYREGPNDKAFIFLEVEKFGRDVRIPKAAELPESDGYLGGSSLGKLLNAEKAATEFALVESSRPCMTLRFPRVDEQTVGQFIMLLEAATTIAGRMFGVNPYDQPAVQLGKEMTFALMGRKGYEKQARAADKHMKRSGRHVV